MPDKLFAFTHTFMRLAYQHRKKCYLFWALELATVIFFSLIDGYFVFFNDANIKYASYHHITVEIRQQRVYGKLNKYITVKQRNHHCYQAHCGLPAEGEYQLDELQFITLNGKDYIKKMCVKNSVCYQNLFDEQVEYYLTALRAQKIAQLWELIWILIVCNVLFYPLMLYTFERHQQEAKMQEMPAHHTEEQGEILI
ncbi:hypothetical protein [Pasteurella sp. PK-2025]|uniref:hypothetical protein n=1 Tax=unclassified Pasteurella TaxID=2621516 RepID=UPI003C76B219